VPEPPRIEGANSNVVRFAAIAAGLSWISAIFLVLLFFVHDRWNSVGCGIIYVPISSFVVAIGSVIAGGLLIAVASWSSRHSYGRAAFWSSLAGVLLVYPGVGLVIVLLASSCGVP
jgi:hypothetical protein